MRWHSSLVGDDNGEPLLWLLSDFLFDARFLCIAIYICMMRVYVSRNMKLNSQKFECAQKIKACKQQKKHETSTKKPLKEQYNMRAWFRFPFFCSLGTVNFCLHCLRAQNDIQCCIIHINVRSSGFNVAYTRGLFDFILSISMPYIGRFYCSIQLQYVRCFLSLSVIPSAFIDVVQLICAIPIILSFCINVVAVVDLCVMVKY